MNALWQTWQQLQENGIASYQGDPEHNLAITKCEGSQQFADFCHCKGLVLDVGCGPQAWPSYFKDAQEITYIGIDPLIGEASRFMRLQALAEFLPFRTRVFDHVVFATSLDHFVDPVTALKSAAQVCKPTGEIDVWLGEKSPNTPKPSVSPKWYLKLHKPTLSEDLFHIRRLNKEAFIDTAMAAGLILVQIETHAVNEFRTNRFYRLGVTNC